MNILHIFIIDSDLNQFVNVIKMLTIPAIPHIFYHHIAQLQIWHNPDQDKALTEGE